MYNVTVYGQSPLNVPENDIRVLHENTRYLYAHVENDLDLY